jgi:hypothetical protein
MSKATEQIAEVIEAFRVALDGIAEGMISAMQPIGGGCQQWLDDNDDTIRLIRALAYPIGDSPAMGDVSDSNDAPP